VSTNAGRVNQGPAARMTDPAPADPSNGDHDEPPSRRGALIAMVVIAVLIVGGIWLSQTLHSVGRIQDCVMAGRNNCAPVGQ
jgi:hypothetical protein